MTRPAPTSFPIAALLTALVAFGPISTDLYLASLPDMARDFHVGIEHTQLTLSVFLVGFAAAMPLYGPLSDRLGRRPVILAGVVIYLIGSLACMLAPSIEVLVASRFLQAVGACCGPVVGRAVVRDVYPRDQAARVMSYMASAMALAPFAAPILGGWVHTIFGWRSNFVLLALFGVALLVAVWRLLDETNAHKDVGALSPLTMAANYRILLGDRVVLGYAATVALVYAGMFTFISAASFVLIELMALPPAMFGFGFAVVISGYITGGLVAGKQTARLGLDRMVLIGTMGCAGAGLGAAILAWSGVVALAAVLLPLMAYFLFAALVLPNATAAAIAPHPRMAGAASAMVGFIQMAAGALAGWLHAASFDHSTRPLGTMVAVLGISALAVFALVVRRRRT
ncbi:MAG TPA: multidrug effflux MFS transporter [Magnetospirillum sp.]|nr:multidrug effflux MFS transporter [Magnetospirillum sp.]